jgi:hypothetical protein
MSGKKYLGLIPHDLGYFHHHFNGVRMSSGWQPPPISISGKSKKVPEFIGWVRGAPIVSEKAMQALAPALNDFVQFFPFHEIKGKKFYAMNVFRVESDLLDLNKSEICFSSDEAKDVLSLDRAVFVTPLPSNLPPIFKVSIRGEILGDIFITQTFVDLAIEHKFTGIALADPYEDPFEMVLNRRPMNVVPGIIEDWN